MLSVIIPSYKDPLLHKTIDSLLDNAESLIEIIAVIDGYELKKSLRKDPRVIRLALKENKGMRRAINAGVQLSRGEYIMRTDEHCKFGKGYDRILTEIIKDNWIVTPRRYKLNPEIWKCFGEPIDHEKLIIGRRMFGKRKGGQKFHAANWPERSLKRADIMIDEKTAMQGSCWIMPRTWWDTVIKELQSEGYGTHYQDSTEITFKTWQAGGKLMLNKNTWYAHKAKEFPRTHHYPIEKADACFKYALEQWREYYDENIRPKIKRWERE